MDGPPAQPARASYPLQLPQLPQSRSSYSGVPPVSPSSPPSSPLPPPSPPPLPNPTHHSTPVMFTKYSTLARLQNISQAPSHYKQTPLLAAQQHLPTPHPQCLKPVMNNMTDTASSPPPPPPTPPPPEMPMPGSAMAMLKHAPLSPQYAPLPPPEEDELLPPTHLHSNGYLPPPPPPEQFKYPPPLSTNGLQQFLAQKFPNMICDFSPVQQDEEPPPPPPVCFSLPPQQSGPPAPPKTFTGGFLPQTAPKRAHGISPISPVPPSLSPTPPATMKKQHSLSSGHSPNQPPPTLPKQYSLSSKAASVSAPISPTQSLVKQIVNQFPDAPEGPISPPVLKTNQNGSQEGRLNHSLLNFLHLHQRIPLNFLHLLLQVPLLLVRWDHQSRSPHQHRQILLLVQEGRSPLQLHTETPAWCPPLPLSTRSPRKWRIWSACLPKPVKPHPAPSQLHHLRQDHLPRTLPQVLVDYQNQARSTWLICLWLSRGSQVNISNPAQTSPLLLRNVTFPLRRRTQNSCLLHLSHQNCTPGLPKWPWLTLNPNTPPAPHPHGSKAPWRKCTLRLCTAAAVAHPSHLSFLHLLNRCLCPLLTLRSHQLPPRPVCPSSPTSWKTSTELWKGSPWLDMAPSRPQESRPSWSQ